jgi:hypothetical protein
MHAPMKGRIPIITTQPSRPLTRMKITQTVSGLAQAATLVVSTLEITGWDIAYPDCFVVFLNP